MVSHIVTINLGERYTEVLRNAKNNGKNVSEYMRELVPEETAKEIVNEELDFIDKD